jgi:hypothetical protein
LDLGRDLVRNLGLGNRVATLERWMAHHVAALIAEADVATGDAKAAAEARAADLILRLWERRRDLHETADPLGSCRDAVEVLSRLRPERNPWLGLHSRGGQDGLLADLFESMARVVVGGVLLTQAGKLRDTTPAEQCALSPEEVALRDQLVWWESAVAPDLPEDIALRLRIRYVAAAAASGEQGGLDASLSPDKSEMGSGSTADELETTGDEAEVEHPEEAEKILREARRPEEQVTKALERLQAEFARLVEAWKAGLSQA